MHKYNNMYAIFLHSIYIFEETVINGENSIWVFHIFHFV